MAVRVNEQMRVTRGKTTPGTGHIVLASGVRDDRGDLACLAGLRARPLAADGRRLSAAVLSTARSGRAPPAAPQTAEERGLAAATPPLRIAYKVN